MRYAAVQVIPLGDSMLNSLLQQGWEPFAVYESRGTVFVALRLPA